MSSSFRLERNYDAGLFTQLEQKAWLFDIQQLERLEETLWDFLLDLKETGI